MAIEPPLRRTPGSPRAGGFPLRQVRSVDRKLTPEDCRRTRLGQDTESLETLVEELRQAHAQLRESHERFERIARTIPCVLYDFVSMPDGTSRFLYLSPRCEEFFEVSAEAVVNRPSLFWKMLHPDDLPGLMTGN